MAVDLFFEALASRPRREILAYLSAQELTAGEIASRFSMSAPAISRHLSVLEGAGLVIRNIQGRNHTCQLDTRPMLGGIEWLRHYEQFWNQRLDALTAALLAEDAAAMDQANGN